MFNVGGKSRMLKCPDCNSGYILCLLGASCILLNNKQALNESLNAN